MLYSLTYSATRGLNAALRRSFRVWDSTAIRVPAATFASTTATLKSTTVAFHQAYAGPSALDKNAGPEIGKGLATAAHRAGMKTLNRRCWCGRNWGQVYSRSLSSSGALRTDDQAEFKKYGFEDVNGFLSSPNPPIIVDVREPAELAATGTIPTAVNIPVSSQPDAMFMSPDDFLARFGFLKPDLPAQDSGENASIVFFCKAGVRAKAAAELAAQAGYDKGKLGVYQGSWSDWQKNGGKVEPWESDN